MDDASFLERRHVAPAPGDVSRAAAGRVARPSRTDPSLRARATACGWCRGMFPARARRDSVYCSKKCRQTAWRLRLHGIPLDARHRAIRVAYADPPYPGLARRYYRSPEVDHVELVARLCRDYPDGWALSTGAYALRELLPLCPAGARVCAWVKPHAPHPHTNGVHNCWEPVIVVGGRQEPPGVRDWLSALPARSGGDLPGRKPIAFCAWLFGLLGLRRGDELADLFPGTGVVSRAWSEVSRRSSETSSGPPERVAVAGVDASFAAVATPSVAHDVATGTLLGPPLSPGRNRTP
jgi:hypothetical protein